jgi:hypothetical protein
MTRDLLSIYLNDHLAGAVGGVELAKRALSSNEGTEFEDFLRKLVAEIEQDKSDLERLMDRLEVRQDPVKRAAAWGAEKVGRLKFNGQLTGYSPLSRLIELEGLSLGVAGKLGLWRALREAVPGRVPDEEIERLIKRAERQRRGLEAQRRRAATIAFG